MNQPLAAGSVVAGRYRIEGELGRGGFGAVYRAIQLPMERPVALKMLLPHALGHDQGFARFRREAELAQRLEHPNTVRLYDFGTAENGAPYIAWELLSGEGVDERLRRQGPMSWSQVLHIAQQALKSLMDAHRHGIVHRDIKPSNLFLAEYPGEPDYIKVLDFGIAKSTVTPGAPMTQVGRTIGTPRYMAPEQAQGGPVGPQTDIYALGLVMAELLVGHPIMAQGSVAEILVAQLSPEPVPLPHAVLATPLGPAIQHATQKALAARTPSAEAMLAELNAVEDASRSRPVIVATSSASMNVPITQTADAFEPTHLAHTPSSVETQGQAPSSGGRRAVLGLLIVGGLGGALTLGAWFVHKRRKANRRSDDDDKDNDKRDEDDDDESEEKDDEREVKTKKKKKEDELDRENDEVEDPLAVIPEGPAFRGVAPVDLRDRIIKADAKILRQHDTDEHTYWVAEFRGERCTIEVERHQRPEDALRAQQVFMRTVGQSIVRDGAVLLWVQHPQQSQAMILLRKIEP